MDAMKVTQQMVAFQKQSFNSFQSVWDLAQTQTSNAVDGWMDQTSWIPREGRKTIEDWCSFMKKERERFTANVDQYFTTCEKMLGSPQAAKPAKKNKTKKAE